MPDPGHALGADANDTFSPDEPPDDAIGRSCGGLTTKVHALTDELCSLNTVLLSAGQAGDNPMLWPLLEAHRTATRASFRLLGDKAFSHNSTRTRLRTMRIKHTIPEKSDQIAHRQSPGLCRWASTGLRFEAVLQPHHRRTRCQPAQAVARNRDSQRQVRADLSRWRHARRHRHLLPRPQ
ncbi:MAG: transposase [Nocardioides sp.]|nr:transposase [Nocardioides sp.]